jgi:hypothetical protein
MFSLSAALLLCELYDAHCFVLFHDVYYLTFLKLVFFACPVLFFLCPSLFLSLFFLSLFL